MIREKDKDTDGTRGAGFSFNPMTEILKAWEKIKSYTRMAITGKVHPDLVGVDVEFIKKQINECILARGGEISSRWRSVELGKIYLNLSKTGKERFMKIIARDFDTDKNLIKNQLKKFENAEDEAGIINAEVELAKTLIPPRLRLLKQFSTLPNGFKFLIDFREELLPIRQNDIYLRKLDRDLKSLLSSWFDIGLLDLTEISWQSPALLLEKLIGYEAVHEIRSWRDLKNRLDSDRLCFAFFHNKIPQEPLIFVEVALMDRIADSIQKILDEEAVTIQPGEADTAIFYSISNAQKGLAGINLGNFLIKRVVDYISNKLEGVKHYATLSPVPKFRTWLDPILRQGDESILTSSEQKKIRAVSQATNAAEGLRNILNSDWCSENSLTKLLYPLLMRLCAYYLCQVKQDKKAYDPVANFHLANGARIERLNWLGDTSKKGMQQSGGIMVNYYYKMTDIEKNHEYYITENRISCAKEIKKWL